MVPPPLKTARLRIRALTFDDAAFILALLNEPAFIEFIGDRGVRSEDDAREYLLAGPLASYARYGFGLCAVDLRVGGTSIGICGLLRRDDLPAPDIGFAFFQKYGGQGYAREAVAAVQADAQTRLGVDPLLAMVKPGNARSIRLLEHLGFRFERLFRLAAEDQEVKLFALVTSSAPARDA